MLLQHRASHFDVDNIQQLVVVNHHPCYGVSDITRTLLYLDIFVFDPHELQLTNLWPGVFFSYFSSFFLEPHEKKTNIAGIASALQSHSFTTMKL